MWRFCCSDIQFTQPVRCNWSSNVYTAKLIHHCGTVPGNKHYPRSVKWEQIAAVKNWKNLKSNEILQQKKLYKNELIWYRNNCSVSVCWSIWNNILDTEATIIIHICFPALFMEQCQYRCMTNQYFVFALHVWLLCIVIFVKHNGNKGFLFYLLNWRIYSIYLK